MKLIQAGTVITSHNNADFDALAAMIAASKLYPDAVLIFPGSQEKSLRHFFIQSATYLFNFRNIRDIDTAAVSTLVLVDTRQTARLSHVQALLDRPDITIHVYDHHIPFSQGIIRPWGSTTAILVAELKASGMNVSPDEATILGCGIYEDTGSFTYSSTTQYDFEAAAWLKSMDMDLNIIADLLHRELNAEQIAILNDLLESAVTHEINGVPVVIAEVTLERYVGDFALLAHKLLDMENVRTLFVLGQMDDRIHLVARSRSLDVDVGRICASLGGGGHAYAASATIKDRTLAQVKDELFALLYTHINPQLLVKDLMSRPPVTIAVTDTIADAKEILVRFGLKALPVVEPGTQTCAGILEGAVVDRAMTHDLGQIQVGEYMMRDCMIINPESDLYPVIEIIIGHRQRMAPVVHDGQLVGVITRTDLINTLIEEPARIPETLLPDKTRDRNIRTLLKERLPASYFSLLENAGRLAQSLGYELYAVGGFVRDILLRRSNLDLDLVVEGDGIAFARELAAQLHGRVRPHPKFKTAVVIFPEPKTGRELRIDVATARLEYYEYPAALPTVELSSIKMDLFRRDFTINALAVLITPSHFGRLVDFFGAQRDVKDRVIRVLHSLSFVEDPTRILRAIRFEQRFNFQIGAQTVRLIKNALQLELVQKLSGSRLFHEFRLIMDEKNPLACLRSMERYNLLSAIHPRLTLTPHIEARIEEIDKVLHWYRLLFLTPAASVWTLYLLALCSGWNEDEANALVCRLQLSPRVQEDVLSLRRTMHVAYEKILYWFKITGPLSELCALLSTMPLEGVLYLMAKTGHEGIRKHLSHYLTSLRSMTIDIRGDDILDLGVPAGPDVGRILKAVLAARIDGQAPTRSLQIDVARSIAAECASSPHGPGPLPTAPSPLPDE